MKMSISLGSPLSSLVSTQSIKDKPLGMMGVRVGDTFVARAMRHVTLWLVHLDSFAKAKRDDEEVGLEMVMAILPTSSTSLASSPEGYSS
jgi:hypothetical protein